MTRGINRVRSLWIIVIMLWGIYLWAVHPITIADIVKRYLQMKSNHGKAWADRPFIAEAMRLNAESVEQAAPLLPARWKGKRM